MRLVSFSDHSHTLPAGLFQSLEADKEVPTWGLCPAVLSGPSQVFPSVSACDQASAKTSRSARLPSERPTADTPSWPCSVIHTVAEFTPFEVGVTLCSPPPSRPRPRTQVSVRAGTRRSCPSQSQRPFLAHNRLNKHRLDVRTYWEVSVRWACSLCVCACACVCTFKVT